MTCEQNIKIVDSLLAVVNIGAQRTEDLAGDHLHNTLKMWHQSICQKNRANELQYNSSWSAALDDILTNKNYFFFLFPSLRDNLNIRCQLSEWTNVYSYSEARKKEIIQKKSKWINTNSDINNKESLLSKLIEFLIDEKNSRTLHWAYDSRYYVFIDILKIYFSDPDSRDIKNDIFCILENQYHYWDKPYCDGYAYQGFERIGITGVKPTQSRFTQYQLDEYDLSDCRVLDIGSNCGFFSAELAMNSKCVVGVEYNPYLIAISHRIKEHFVLNNLQFVLDSFEFYNSKDLYDVVFSLSNHHTIDGNLSMNFEEYVMKVFRLMKTGGILFFETHNVFGKGTGVEGDDGDFDYKLSILETYFVVEKYKMVHKFVNYTDIDKLFVILKRRKSAAYDIKPSFCLTKAIKKYSYN